MLKETYEIPDLPPQGDFETIPILKALAVAHRYLAELKGRAAAIPNQAILINTLSLQEARASSEIENIITTQDEMFRADIFTTSSMTGAAKEVSLYRDALNLGYQGLLENNGIISNNAIISMYQLLKGRSDGFRSASGTALRNDATGRTVYVPPQHPLEITRAMTALEAFINDDDACALDPLIKMAIIHHQFESIHPFFDGNGRLGRILNVLYLTRTGLLDTPVLYLSRYITSTKSDYYQLLQSVRDDGAWEAWVLYILNGVSQTSRLTLWIIEELRRQIADYKQRIRNDLPRLYSQELLNNLFRHPYTRIEFLQNDLSITRQTASRYLESLAEGGFLEEHQRGRNKYFLNPPLVKMLISISDEYSFSTA